VELLFEKWRVLASSTLVVWDRNSFPICIGVIML
jgi:hypothetical protein